MLIGANGEKWLSFRNATIKGKTVCADYEILAMPPEALAIFRNFEELVNIQAFSCLNELYEPIDQFGLKVLWEETVTPVRIYNVQVTSGGVSFRLTPL